MQGVLHLENSSIHPNFYRMFLLYDLYIASSKLVGN